MDDKQTYKFPFHMFRTSILPRGLDQLGKLETHQPKSTSFIKAIIIIKGNYLNNKYGIENIIIIYKGNYFLYVSIFGKKLNNEYGKSQIFHKLIL